MAFSQVPDTCFTWIINDFNELNVDSLPEKSFCSAKFTTSREPSRKWHLLLSINKFSLVFRSSSKCGNPNCSKQTITKNIIDLKIVCDETIPNPEDIKVDISMIKDLEKITRSFIVHGNKETKFGYDNFIDCEAMLQMVDDGKLKIFVEMFLLKERKKNFDIIRDSKFLSDIQISINDQKYYAHKALLAAKSPYFYQLFQQNKEISEINNLNITQEGFTEILKYIYSDNLEKWFLSCDIIIGATILQMEDLKSECENYIRNNINFDCVNVILILAVECNTTILLKHCLQYILHNINMLGKLQKFQCLQKKPQVVLNILLEIFHHFKNGKITIVDSIKLSYTKVAINTSSDQLQDYESFFNNESLSDLTIHVGTKTYHSHKLVLGAKSRVFREMLIDNMEKASNDSIEIKDIKAEVFDEVLRYMYTGKVKNLQAHGIEILKAADKYNLDHLKKMCEEFLAENLTDDNVVQIVHIADSINASFLIERCCDYILKYMLTYAEKKQVENIITLDMFINCHHNILYEFLDLLSKHCQIIYN